MNNPAQRHQKILELLDQNGQASVTELMEVLLTSRETVRRDLNELSNKGLLIKTHGGAVSMAHKAAFGFFTPLNNRRNAYQAEKLALCRFAANSVEEYDTIYIDNSTTAAHLIDFIPKYYKLTFITNSIGLLTEFSMLHNPNWNIVSLGGILSYETYSVNRYLAMNNLQYFQPNKSFISCHGIGEDFSVTDTNIDDVELKRYVVSACKETSLLVDASKMPRRGVVKIADASDFHCIITNDNIDSAFLCQLVSHDCSVKLAPLKVNK
jgi:Transcriptional regulators of sugar metabolism